MSDAYPRANLKPDTIYRFDEPDTFTGYAWFVSPDGIGGYWYGSAKAARKSTGIDTPVVVVHQQLED